MQILRNILSDLSPIHLVGEIDITVTGIEIDSRKVIPGCVFIAVKGVATDGHNYIEIAISKGAVAIVCQNMPETKEGIAYIQVEDSSEATGLIAAAYYGFPSSEMKVVGITGTNGKTTTATLLYKLFEGLGYKCGLISTVQNHIHLEIESATHTTPNAIALQALLRKMADAGCSYVFMEVSSHAIHQQRILGIHFTGAVFTNISHDHLDYHKTFDEYIRVKKSFFDNLSKNAFALTNADDKRGLVMLQNTLAQKNTYSLKTPSTFKGKIIENSLAGLLMIVDNQETHFRLIGTFNAYNLLAVYSTAILLKADKMQVLQMLSSLQGAKGRFETYLSENEKILGIIDYAHSPDALINVLATINQLRTHGQTLITVVGCGGDRDKAKRPIMAEVACKQSDKTILTSDNPRTENPEEILNEMESGLSAVLKRKYLRITDRRESIKTAVMLSQPGSIILVAGKGHENYQEINGIKYHFDDMEELMHQFKIMDK